MTTIVGPGKEVSEKSLELNICAEFLQHIRSWPGCERALWLGLTQRQERRTGLDELIRNVGSGFLLMLQFKAPWRSSNVDSLYKFNINERQHEALEQLANDYPAHVFYVFPLYTKWTKADQYAPDLAQDTWMVPISSLPLSMLTSQSTPASGRHRVEVERFFSQVTVTVHSPIVEGKVINAKEYFTDADGQQSLNDGIRGVPSERLQEWSEEWDDEFAPRFRGLNALFIPGQ